MPETTTAGTQHDNIRREELRRMDDAFMERFSVMLDGHGEKLDALRESFHLIEIHLAKLESTQDSAVKQSEYRLGVLETRMDTAGKYINGIIIAVITAVLIGVVNMAMSSLAGLPHK